MKKILFVLLIAVIFCSQIAEENKTELDLDDSDVVLQDIRDFLKETWFKVKNTFNSAVEFLKKHDLYDTVVNLLKGAAEVTAFVFCKKKLSEDTCKSIIDFVKDAIKSNKA